MEHLAKYIIEKGVINNILKYKEHPFSKVFKIIYNECHNIFLDEYIKINTFNDLYSIFNQYVIEQYTIHIKTPIPKLHAFKPINNSYISSEKLVSNFKSCFPDQL
jgi:hypothetical protein